MRNSLALAVGLISALALIQRGTSSNERAISLDDLQDRIEGGWAGQMVGVAYGYPTNPNTPLSLIHISEPTRPY